jgi:hypothetical protein
MSHPAVALRAPAKFSEHNNPIITSIFKSIIPVAGSAVKQKGAKKWHG